MADLIESRNQREGEYIGKKAGSHRRGDWQMRKKDWLKRPNRRLFKKFKMESNRSDHD